MLQKESLDKKVLDLIYALQEKEYLKDFFLVGGTGLALVIGHHKSVDIDLFTLRDFNAEILLEKLESEVDFSMDNIDKNSIKGYAEGIKVDLLSHKYPLIHKTLEIEELRIARESSPYFFISRETSPVMIFHGTKDLLVPYSQATGFITKLKENDVPSLLITKNGAGHGWPYERSDDELMIKWFEKYLLSK